MREAEVPALQTNAFLAFFNFVNGNLVPLLMASVIYITARIFSTPIGVIKAVKMVAILYVLRVSLPLLALIISTLEHLCTIGLGNEFTSEL